MLPIEKLSIDTIRSLCIDEINKANSGHPGMALGSAPILFTLFSKHLIANPMDDKWSNRDRFILSAGHASSLLYAMLHLCGYPLSMEDLKNFRQLGSLTPGHPEFDWTKGVDATSGPLGQGIAQAVGMAMAERSIAANYKDGSKLMNHYTYVLCGDGCLQEGISQEAISIAGHHKLNKLILFYDANDVTLDGPLSLSFSENIPLRFKACNWDVIEIKDGNNINDIDKAIDKAKRSKDKPTLIIVHTVIGYGSSKAGTNKVHGSPLGLEDGANTKKSYGFDHPDFYVPTEVYDYFKNSFVYRGTKAYSEYNEFFKKYEKDNPSEAKRFLSLQGVDVSPYLSNIYPDFEVGSMVATRASSGKALNYYNLMIPNLIGGAADVASSVQTSIKNGKLFTPNTPEGHTINFGIREFVMGAICNGMLLHGGVRTYCGLFLVFTDYMKNAIRMAALSKLPSIYICTHDSIAVGEDGPTHQPIEQVATLRTIPNINVVRPADEKETFGAWRLALASTSTPTALILSRQNLPVLKNTDPNLVEKGAYVVSSETSKAQLVLIATGSEVDLAIKAQELLRNEKIDVRVVSMPCTELFDKQDDAYKKSVINLSKDKCISIEMLTTFGWAKYADNNIGIDSFGASGNAKDVLAHFNFNAEYVKDMAKKVLGK